MPVPRIKLVGFERVKLVGGGGQVGGLTAVGAIETTVTVTIQAYQMTVSADWGVT